jgi:hypothetical protein
MGWLAMMFIQYKVVLASFIEEIQKGHLIFRLKMMAHGFIYKRFK